MATVREQIFQVLRNHGLNTIFGNPGSTELPFLQNFPMDFSYILGLHEGSVVAMAVGFAFMQDKPAVVNLHTTAGVGNAMGAIVTAWHAQAPIMITAGQQDRRQIFTEPLLWGRQVDFVKPYVKWSIEPHRSIDIPNAIERAYHVANTDPKGPVFVSIPMDGLEDECPPVEMRTVTYRTAPDPNAIAEVVKIISQTKKIALVAGEQIDAAGANSDMVKLAERLNAPVYLSPISRRSSFPSDHRLYRGRLPPGIKPLSDALSPFDTVLVIGSSVFMYYPYIPGDIIREGTRVLQITNDPQEASRAVTGTSVIGNVAIALRQLLELVEPREASQQTKHRVHPKVESSIPPKAEFVLQELAEAIPANAIIFQEAPSSQPSFRQLHFNEPKSYFSTASGGLGFAMPAAVGAALAQVARQVVCIVGEGSAQYCIQSLWSAVKYGANVTFIVLNNEEYAILKSFGKFLQEEEIPGLDVTGIDFEGLAKGYGINFKRIL